MSNKQLNPGRGEIWLVEFNPQVGTEIMKTRPAVILTIKLFESQSTRIIVPIRHYEPHHNEITFYVILEPSKQNKLDKKSTVDCIQIKSFDKIKFSRKIGNVTEKELTEISKIVAFAVGYLQAKI